jgi:hypothetical protein
LSTATQCVRQVFPGSEIVEHLSEAKPSKVRITAETGGAKPIEIWSGRQQSLFAKNRQQREQSMAEIVKKLNELKGKIEHS